MLSYTAIYEQGEAFFMRHFSADDFFHAFEQAEDACEKHENVVLVMESMKGSLAIVSTVTTGRVT